MARNVESNGTTLLSKAIRRLPTFVIGLLLTWAVFAVSFDNVVGPGAPALAARFGAASDLTQANAALVLLGPQATRDQVAEAQRLAESAIRTSPVNVTAVQVLAVVAVLHNDQRKAERLFDYGETLSRRNLAVELALIERAVQRNSIAEALLHYDRALRTHEEARELLFPILAAAASGPEVAQPLGRILAARPEWWLAFVTSLAGSSSTSPQALASISRQLRLNPHDTSDRQLLLSVLARLIASRNYGGAYDLYRTTRGFRQERSGVNDGGFEADPILPPFDWQLLDEIDLGAAREARAGGNVLRLQAGNSRAGQVARQLLLLTPGRYRLSFVAGDVGGDPASRPTISISCPETAGPPLIELRASNANEGGGSVSTDFQLPGQGCSAQWLAISIAASGDVSNAPWIDQVTVAPAGSR